MSYTTEKPRFFLTYYPITENEFGHTASLFFSWQISRHSYQIIKLVNLTSWLNCSTSCVDSPFYLEFGHGGVIWLILWVGLQAEGGRWRAERWYAPNKTSSPSAPIAAAVSRLPLKCKFPLPPSSPLATFIQQMRVALPRDGVERDSVSPAGRPLVCCSNFLKTVGAGLAVALVH